MDVNKLRPQKLMIEHEKLRQTDIKILLSSSSMFKRVGCPACQKINNKVAFKKNGFTFIRCKNCQTLYVSPRPSPTQLEDYYANSKSIQLWNDKIFPASDSVRKRHIFKPRARKVIALSQKYMKKPLSLIDIGAGYGTFCEEIRHYKFFKSIVAIEPSASLAKTCRDKGIDVIEKPIEKVKGVRADVVTCFELIEHLFNPGKFIKSCAQILSPGGLLILTTPNIMGFDLLLLQQYSDNVNAPNHLNYFHPRSLTMLLNKNNFTTLETLTPGKLDAQNVKNKIVDGTIKPPDLFLEHVLIKDWNKSGIKFQRFISQNNLSSHLWIVAKKVK